MEEIPRGQNAKYWILPDGKIENLGKLWHYEWLQKNIKKLKKYGIKEDEMPEKGETPIRLYAMNKGFVRMNFMINGGKLTIESTEGGWSRTSRNAIQDFIFDNINRIDNLYIAVMDSSGRVKKNASTNWMTSSEEEKQNSIPFITENAEEIKERRDKLILEYAKRV